MGKVKFSPPLPKANPLPDTDTAMGYGQQAGGAHPTVMHPCYLII